jgi:DNA-binding CsgD family transcriptional regulator
MTPKGKWSQMREVAAWAAAEKSLLSLHGSSDIESFWKAVQKVIQTSIPRCFLGLTLQRDPTLAVRSDWTCQLPAVAFSAVPFQAYYQTHPRSKFMRLSDVFGNGLRNSSFYQQHMAPRHCIHAVALFFWNGPNPLCVMTIMRTKEQGDITEGEAVLLRRLYPQFRTALRRLVSLEEEHSAHQAFEDYLRRLPLATMLLGWNMEQIYQSQAAREFCGLWQRGRQAARLLKPNAPLPAEFLDGCGRLRKRWEEVSPANLSDQGYRHETVHHPDNSQMRATISLKASPGITPPHFLVECEELLPKHEQTQLPHLARLTKREQEITRFVCDGRSNQEIADTGVLSVAMVKKHLHSIFRKLEITSRSRLIALMR